MLQWAPLMMLPWMVFLKTELGAIHAEANLLSARLGRPSTVHLLRRALELEFPVKRFVGDWSVPIACRTALIRAFSEG